MQKNIPDVTHVVSTVEKTVSSVMQEADSYVEPVRKSAFTRFPTLFIILVTFGVATTFFGFERLIADIAFLNNRPLLILLLGVSVLAGTGTLYKKLG